MNPLDNLTVCVTNFKRTNYLDRTLRSLRAAGIRRVVIASIAGSEEVEQIIQKHSSDWLSYDVARLPNDIGCNNTWMLAAYHSQTDRIIIMHDDDALNKEFGEAYRKLISPALDDRKVGFASWRASLLFDDGVTKATEFWHGPTRVIPARELLKVVAKHGRLSLSPIISVLDRTTVIHACKEAEQTLTHNDCLLHPGMLLGTEILVYMRHIQRAPEWLYVDKVLAHYGSHGESGTIKAEVGGSETMKELFRGYDLARNQGGRTKPAIKPKVLLVNNEYEPRSVDETKRVGCARKSWEFLFDQFEILHFPVPPGGLRSAAHLGETDPVVFVRDLFDYGCRFAMPEDVVAVANTDVGLTLDAASRLIAGVANGFGITACPRRNLEPVYGRMYRHLANCKTDGGMDIFAVSPAVWKGKISKVFPDFLNGREAWDTCLRTLAEEHADGRRRNALSTRPEQWEKSKAYTDHVCWHKPHVPKWTVERLTNPGQLHNRKLAKEFFRSRGFNDQVRALSQ